MKKWRALILAFLFVFSCGKQEPALQPTTQSNEDEYVFCLDNPLVAQYLNFLDRHPYDDDDYTYSYIDDFYAMTTSYRKDHPLPAKVKWEKAAGGGIQHIHLAFSPELDDATVYSLSGSAVSYDIYNLIPGRNYWWKVTDSSDETIVGSGTFSTTGHRRFLKVDNICNVRDLGGIPTADGSRHIKYGLLFRGGEMNGYHQDYDALYCRISGAGKTAMKKLGIAADLDMRTADEAVNITASPLGEDIDYIRFEKANDYYYDNFWGTDEYILAVKWAINELKAGKPVFFHCIYGADRTGTLAFIMEALLGVDENQLAIDYELTSFSHGLTTPPRRRGPKNELSVYRYRQMVAGVKSYAFTGATLQERIYNFLSIGIPAADLDWFIENLLEE